MRLIGGEGLIFFLLSTSRLKYLILFNRKINNISNIDSDICIKAESKASKLDQNFDFSSKSDEKSSSENKRQGSHKSEK